MTAEQKAKNSHFGAGQAIWQRGDLPGQANSRISTHSGALKPWKAPSIGASGLEIGANPINIIGDSS
jgi:hypothetical protein